MSFLSLLYHANQATFGFCNMALPQAPSTPDPPSFKGYFTCLFYVHLYYTIYMTILYYT